MAEIIENTTSGEFEKLLEEGGFERIENEKNIQNGLMIEGSVIKVTNDDVFLDIGIKTEGVISLNEFTGKPPKEGDRIKAIVVRRTSESVYLSFSKAKSINTWDEIKTAYQNKLTVTAKIVEIVKGGMIAVIDQTVKSFVPISQIDLVHVDEETIQSYMGKTLEFKIIKIDKNGKGNNVVLSRKKLLQEEKNEQKNNFFAEKKEGDIITGIVKNHASFGVFVDLGGFDGLLHVSDLSWGKNVKPTEIAPKGKELKLSITKLDAESEKINLSLKALEPNPWEMIHEKFNEGDTVTGTVVKILPYGVFVHIEDSIEGFVHVSDMSWTKRVNHPKDILKLQSVVECKILLIEKDKQRLSLGIKQVEENPWDTIEERYPKGLKIKAKIVKVLMAGLIVELDDYIKGFVSQDDYTWAKKNTGANFRSFSEGQEIECKILDHDLKNHELRLGIKQLEENPWEKNELKAGQVVEGTVVNITDFGIFVKIGENIEGLIPKFQAYDPNEVSSYEEAKKLFKKGEVIQTVVQNINSENQRLTLSVKELKEVANKKEIEKHLVEDVETHNINLGDILAQNDQKHHE